MCRRCKHETVAHPDLLQPLEIPDRAWTNVTMDFIEGMPKSEVKDCILVVVDWFTKFGHFIGLSHPFTAQEVVRAYLENVVKLHGIPQSIVSDRDKVFTSLFWKELMRILGTKLLMSTFYHLETDGQME